MSMPVYTHVSGYVAPTRASRAVSTASCCPALKVDPNRLTTATTPRTRYSCDASLELSRMAGTRRSSTVTATREWVGGAFATTFWMPVENTSLRQGNARCKDDDARAEDNTGTARFTGTYRMSSSPETSCVQRDWQHDTTCAGVAFVHASSRLQHKAM